MKRMMGLMMYGGILFGLSAGGAWFLRSQHMMQLQQAQQRNAEDPQQQLLAPSTTAHPTIVHPELPDAQRDDVLSRVPARPEPITAEEIVRHGLDLKKRREAIAKREEALQRVQAQYSLMLNEIQGEQREIEGLMVQAREQRKAADELLRQATTRHQEATQMLNQAEKRKQENRELLDQIREEQQHNSSGSLADAIAQQEAEATASAADREVNIQELAGVLASMTPEVGAGILREFMDDGKISVAVQLVSNLEEAKAGEILDTMNSQQNGTEVVKQLLDRFAERPDTARVTKGRQR